MKLHIVTVGQPKLAYARAGWDEYCKRLQRLHTVRVTHLGDKHAGNSRKILAATDKTYRIALVINGTQLDSSGLAGFLTQLELKGKEVSCIIGGPDGLPQAVIQAVDYTWSLGALTLPHDLAMVVTLEALYRASTINAHLPYHR